MSVMLVTSLGDIVIDLHTDRCPLTTKNFLKLCKMKYYNGCLFHKVEKDFTAQTGDRTGTGQGGDSLYKFLYGDQARFFDDEIHPDLKHAKRGTVAMASAGKNCNASQFYFTLRDELDYLDGKHTVFGIVEEEEGLDTLAKINETFVDDKGRPYKNIRIKHTYILDDPFSDPPQLTAFIPEKSPEGKPDDETAEERLEDNWVPMEETLGVAELEEVIREKEAHTNAAILETIGDIPDADIKPPENVLFVCKLNPVTQDEDLHTIFSRFGNVVSADIIRDYKTGDSLCYAFIEFESQESCELAYFKMDNTLIDDRRIHVDFSQSVCKLWSQYRHGKRTQNNDGGCFKCGAPDHIAKNCSQGSEGQKEPLKYVLKEGNTQRGDANRSYDMVFEGEHLGKAHSGDEANIGRKKLKLDDHGYEEQSRRGYDQNSRDLDSRSYKYHSDHRRKIDRQDVERTSSQRDRGRASSDRDQEKHQSNRLSSDGNREKHATDRRSGESQKREDEKKYESSRHGRVRREHRERGSTHDTHSRDEARDASINKKESVDQHIHRHHRNEENGKHSSGVDQDKFSQQHESDRPRGSESRSSDRHREGARDRRADEKNMHLSRRARDDDMYRKIHERS